MKILLLIVTFLSFMLTTEAQKKRPQKLKRTEANRANDEANRANDCMMPIFEDEIFLFSPEDEIEKALKSDNLPELKKLINQISYGVDFIWMLSSECD